MVKVSAILCSALVLLAITIGTASDTNITYQIGEFNSKLTYLQGRLDLFDYITEGNVSVLQHRVEIDDLKYAENVTKQMNESNENVKNLVDRIDTLATDVCKINAFESKFNALATTVSSNVSTLLQRVEEKDLKYAENVKVQINETNVKLNDLVDRIESLAIDVNKLNGLESKLNALESTVTNLANTITNLVGPITELLLKPLSNCVDAFARPLLNRGSGVYKIQSNVNSPPFNVYCMADPKGGLPWTVVQRRVDGSVDFYRNWTEYQRGFGDLEGNFFIGLETLHMLTTKSEPQELWVKLTNTNGVSAHAYYDRFAISNEAEKYSLKELGAYSGDAGDSLTYSKSMKFSTRENNNDRDNRLHHLHCANEYKTAWWMNDCTRSNLNGVYGTDHGMYWLEFRGYLSMKYAHMAIRPANK